MAFATKADYDRWYTKNKKKRQAYQKAWYTANKKTRLKKLRLRRQAIVEWFRRHKAKQKCKECGERHPATLDYHHRDPKQKKMLIAYMVRAKHSIASILKEMAKCDVLCSNCHRILHWNEQWG